MTTDQIAETFGKGAGMLGQAMMSELDHMSESHRQQARTLGIRGLALFWEAMELLRSHYGGEFPQPEIRDARSIAAVVMGKVSYEQLEREAANFRPVITRARRRTNESERTFIGPRWKRPQTFIAFWEASGRVLALQIGPSDFVGAAGCRWLVVAVEANAGALTASDVFDDHSHKALGTFDKLSHALDAAEAYGDAWLPGVDPACQCTEINPTTRAPARRSRK